MSRIYVKDLPRHLKKDRLREIFSEKGEITDVQLIRAKDGKSRQFAYIGFRTDHEAQKAVQYFNKSYIDTYKIACEVSQNKKGNKVTTPHVNKHATRSTMFSSTKQVAQNKKDNKVTTPYVNKHARAKGQGDNSNGIVDIDDPQLLDFLQVMQPRAKSKLWANDTSIVSSVGNNQEISNKRKGTKEWSDSKSSDDEDDDDSNDKAQMNAREQRGQLSNPEYAKGVSESCQLFVHNLPYTTTEEELEEHFSQFGSVSQVHLVVAKDTKRSKGRAYILFSVPEFASRAAKELNETIFQGRWLYVCPAIQRSSNNEENNVSKDQGSKSLKQQRVEKRKAAETSGDTRAWNSLFMRLDTVVENIARKYGVSKSDLLDREADDLAVCIALGETQVISETKKAFKNAGVNVESLEELANGKVDSLKRSNHVLLVKNLPYGSSENELVKMFGKFGSLDKIIHPPTKTLALVVFLEPAEAKAAFRGLAYKRYKDAPLYLEWAPFNILSQNSAPKNNEMNSGISENDVKRVILEQNVERVSDVDMDPDRIEARTLCVKNLNFKTTDESLRKHLSEHMKEGRVLSVKVKKHLKNGENVSMGYGFVEFDSMETAKNVWRDLQGSVLDDYALSLQHCHVKNDGKVQKAVEKGKSSTKLFVRNVAFEATKKDLRQLFSPFGQIKSLRLPTKFGNDRGFAFVEFVTQQEAQNALSALSSTHLYGRHLVIEPAKEDESLDELRARAAAQFSENNEFQNATKLSRKRKHISILDEGKMTFERIAD